MNVITKRHALPLIVLGSMLSAPAFAGPAVIASIYTPSIDVGSMSASPDGIILEIRQPVGGLFWVGASLGSALSSDQIAPGVDVDLGTSLDFNLGVQKEFSHYVAGYAYVGYGTAKVTSNIGDMDGQGVAWGAGLQFRLADQFVADAGYASLFDDKMEDSSNTQFDTKIAGPRVGVGFRF